MNWWVYKCNNRPHSKQVTWGDWKTYFNEGGGTEWGNTERVPALKQLKKHDQIIAFQSDRNELVGLATVSRFVRRGNFSDVILETGEEIGAKVRPLKKADPKIARIPALQPGPIKTIYSITTEDASRLLKAARAAMLTNRSIATGVSGLPEVEEEQFIEGEKRATTSSVRNPRLRLAAKNRWGSRCYCCGFDFERFYGKFARGAAVVHHLKQFGGHADSREATVADVRVVCANCHLAIHLTRTALDTDILKSSISADWDQWTVDGIRRAN